jgi:PAS domain S-box-containing protein
LSEAADQSGVVLANLPAGPTERRTALVIGLVLLGIGILVVPFGRIQLPESNAGPAVASSLVFLADLITWFLLISQFKIVRSRALLILASGYLFTGAMNVPVLLTMWNQFSPTGLLGAGLQTSLWLALAGFTGYPLAVFFYAVMKKEPRAPAVHGTSSTAIAASVAIVIAIVLALTWIATAGESHLPKIVWPRGQPAANLQHVGTLLLLFAAAALLLLWSRRRSVLDLWLSVAMCAWWAQGIAKWIHSSGRWSLSFYVGGWLFVISSTVLLVVLLKETMTLYGRLAVSLVALRRLSAEKLLRSEAYLSEAQRLSHTGSFGRSLFSGEIYWSDETYRIFEHDRSVKPTLESVLQRIHPDDVERVRQTIDRATWERTGFDFEYRLLRPDGSVKYLHILARASEPSSDDFEFVGAVTDVTSAKQAEETLRQSEAYLAEAQRLSHTGSWAWIPVTGEMRYWSEECYRVLGFDPQSGPPRFETLFHRIHPEDQQRSAETFERARRERAEFEMDNRLIHPGGEIRDIHVVGHPVLIPSGDLVEFVGTVFDVTERKQAEKERERLRQTEADLARVSRVTTMGELAASLAHEIMQPITAAVIDAKTCLRWLTRDQPDMEEAREAASRTVTDATRAVDIMSRIRSQFQKGSLNRELVDVNEVIREMIALLQSEAMQYNITVRTELAADLPQIMGDRLQLQQVTMNLIANSIDAMKDVEGPRELAIKSQRTEEEQLQVSVIDTGIGLPPQQADQIFNPFFTTKPHGTGMGLRISRSIVESHGGHLWATANSGRGATFYFTMPTAAEVVKATATLA